MALTPSGAISMADLNTALGRSSTASISLSDTQVRFISAAYSGAVNMNGLRNKYNWNGTATMSYFEEKGGARYGYENGFGSSTGTLVGNPLQSWQAINQDGSSAVYTLYGYAPSPNPPPTGTFRARTGTDGNIRSGTFSYSGGNAETFLVLTYVADVPLVTYAQTLQAQPLTWQVSSA
jgi:hypothetical protein